MFDKDNKFGFINNNSNNNELNSSDIKKYIDDKADILELKNIETISENLYSKNFLIVESKWIAFIDTDEFINIKDNSNINDFMQQYEKYDGLYIDWLTYNANGKIKKKMD